MKNYIKCLMSLVLFTSLVLSNSTAQNIPDANFALYIQTQCPTCIDANKNLTAAAASVTSLDVSSGNISDLTGIVGFTNLQNLTCEFNPLTSLPTLPSNLRGLNCSYNQLTSISNLPNSLQYLDCTFNALTNLSNLPSSLQKLFCGANSLTSLPTLPNGLKELECNFNAITHLPNLPSGLEIMYCGGNSLTNLPVLPNSLTNLFCYDNQITNLPALPTNLTQLRCQNNRLTSLPSLPTNFSVLYCENNQLSNLPNLPTSLTYLSCSNNQIACLPTLPNSLTYLRIDADKVLCLPNAVANLTIQNAAGSTIVLPTCSSTIVTHPSVSGNPAVGQTINLTAKANISGSSTVKWQRKRASESIFSDISGTATAYLNNSIINYRINSLTLADLGASFRAVFGSSCSASITSNAVMLGSALPVELLKLTGNTEGGKNHLIWQTAIEDGTNNFEIERSLDGIYFIKMGEIKAQGSNSTYAFVDDKPAFGLNYYRLEINDLDGKTRFSKIISLLNTAKSSLKIYPNPTTDVLTVELSTSAMFQTFPTLNAPTFQIINLLGQIILRGVLQNDKANQSIDVSSLPTGTYIVQVGEEQVKFVKQ